MNRVRTFLAVATLSAAATSVSVISSTPVSAGSGVDTFDWGSAGVSVSKNQNRYSNISGMWQEVLTSSDCNVLVDGDFGNQTEAATEAWQRDLIPAATIDGIAGPQTWASVATSAASVEVRWTPAR